jgi:beta-galactosidase
MKRILLLFSLSLPLCGSLNGQDKAPYWEDPEVFAVNKEAPRATAVPYSGEAEAAQGDYTRSVWYRSLNGLWKFHWVPRVAEVPAGFEKEDYDVSDWAEMPVPGNWEFNGYGVPMYVNTGFGFRAAPPRIDRQDSPVGAYRRTFDLPADWDGRRVFIHFEGGTSAMYVWVNGRLAGYTENAKSPAEFDITDLVRPGQNTLACQVHRFSDGTYLEDQDMWRMGGIHRNVYLYSTADTRIRDFFARPDLDPNYRNGQFSVEVELKNYAAHPQDRTIEVSLLDASGRSVLTRRQRVSIPRGATSGAILSGKVSDPLKWTAETPNLYTMVLTLRDGNGRTVESVSHRIGFRKIEIVDGQLLVNGRKVWFKGVNLHEFNTNTGNVVDSAVMIRNIELMKQLNINAVRTSHYPQPPLWYRLCDQYGIYLVDEANLESHGMGYGPDNVSNFPEWQAAHMDRIYNVVERDKNHPSVIFWSLGNEASNGKAYFEMYDWAKGRDGSRPVQYEQAHQRDRNTDIICPMYPSWNDMRRDAAKDLGRPYIMCEYAHAMGNSMGNLPEYWDLMRSSKNMQGGFIWEWYNHAYATRDEQGRTYWAYGGDLGGYDKMNNDNFCIDGIISPDQQFLPHTHIVKKVYQNILFSAEDPASGVVTLHNDHVFTPITPADHSFRWTVLKNGEPFAEGTFETSIPAGESREVTLDLPVLAAEAGMEYYLQIFALNVAEKPFVPVGFEVAKEEFQLPQSDYFAPRSRSGQLQINEQEGKTMVTSGPLVYEFSTRNGRTLLRAVHNGNDIFRELPRMDFWRAPTDNEFGEWAHVYLRLWEAATHNVIYTFRGMERGDKGSAVFRYRVKPRGIEAEVELTYTVDSDGSLSVDAHYKALSDDLPEMMRLGMVMAFDKQYENLTWYGRGPHENYVDRNKETFMGIWSGKVKDQTYPYIRPQEGGNKTDVRWLSLTNHRGKGIRIEGGQPLSVNASHYRTEDLDPGLTKKQMHHSDLKAHPEVILNVDLFQRGVGGLQSWGAPPLDPYRFWGKEYRYAYRFVFDL